MSHLKTNQRQHSVPRQGRNPGWQFYLASYFLLAFYFLIGTPRGLGYREFTSIPVQLPYDWLNTCGICPPMYIISPIWARGGGGVGAGERCSNSMLAWWLGLVQWSGIIIWRLTKHNRFRDIRAWSNLPMSILYMSYQCVSHVTSVSR